MKKICEKEIEAAQAEIRRIGDNEKSAEGIRMGVKLSGMLRRACEMNNEQIEQVKRIEDMLEE